ncbi:hypothetical protein VTL71DRAFT_4181 [Oculimacula yallundae]|uniref:2EXR domain-containing protein n=1 Tax=Oculimacula yallundae TaxID=86028 RepID=A0ABR4C6T7_9HELO
MSFLRNTWVVGLISSFFLTVCAQNVLNATSSKESAANPIADIYPNGITGTFNSSILVVPIPFELARSIIPGQWAINRKAYCELLPGFPTNSYPLVVRSGVDHGVGVRSLNLTLNDFQLFHTMFPFVDFLGDGYSSFTYKPYLPISKENTIASAATLEYGTIPIPSTFSPNLEAYAYLSSGESPQARERYLNVSAEAGTPSNLQAAVKFIDVGSVRPWPMNFYVNVTNQVGTHPEKFPVSGPLNSTDSYLAYLRECNTTLSTGDKAPRGVKGSVTLNKPLLPQDSTFSDVFGIRVDTAFLEITQKKCVELKGYHAQPRPPPGIDDPLTRPPITSRPSSHHAPRPNAHPIMHSLSHSLNSRLRSAKTLESNKRITTGSKKTPPMYTFTRTFPSGQTSNSPKPTRRFALSALLSDAIKNLHENLIGNQMGPQSPGIRSNVRQSSMAARMSSSPNITSPTHRSMVSTTDRMVSSSSRSTIGQKSNPEAPLPASATCPTQQQDLARINHNLNLPGPTSPITPVPAVHQLPAGLRRQPPVTYLSHFSLFPNLPLGLQQEIWSIAIAHQQYKEKRFLRVAPDSESLGRTDDESHGAQLRIISDLHRRPRLVPSLLHACQYSRRQAIQGYELWGCADPITYEEHRAKVYVKTDVDCFFFGDADLGDFWVFDTFLKESESETENADDTARINFMRQIGQIKHFSFDYELWIQMLEYEALWLANLDSATKLTIAVRNPNHEELRKDYALCFLRNVIPQTFRDEAARIIIAMTLRSLHASSPDFRNMDWPSNGTLQISVRSLSMCNSTGSTPEDESYLEDVLIEGNRFGLISDQYLAARLSMMHQGPPPPPPPPAPAPVPTPTL